MCITNMRRWIAFAIVVLLVASSVSSVDCKKKKRKPRPPPPPPAKNSTRPSPKQPYATPPPPKNSTSPPAPPPKNSTSPPEQPYASPPPPTNSTPSSLPSQDKPPPNGLSFYKNYYFNWGSSDHCGVSNHNKLISLKLDNSSGSAFQSIKGYIYGYFSMNIKLVPGESAGVVATFYLSSETKNRDEVDFEFLGNRSGEPWVLHTNIFTNGTGGREQRTFLWFDPTADFHTYSLLWNPYQIVWYVDSIPFRVYRNTGPANATFPHLQKMGIHCSLWNGDAWATRGGLEKINWAAAPFIAKYSGFWIDTCTGSSSQPLCSLQQLDPSDQSKYTSKLGYRIYDYCLDKWRYPVPMPECSTPPWD